MRTPIISSCSTSRGRALVGVTGAAALLALCSPALAAGPMQPGDQIAATKDTPALLATALKSHQTVVVSFLMPGSADDRLVGDAVAGVRKTPLAKRGVRFITYQLGRSPKDMGMAAELLGVAGTPSVAVIDPQGKLQTRFLGVIDQSMVTQAIADTNPPGPGPKKKIAKKVGKKVGAKTPAKSTPDRKSTRLNSSHGGISRMPSSA